MNNKELLGMSPGLRVFVTACFTIGAVFTGANGLTTVALIAALAAVAMGSTVIAELTRSEQKPGVTVGIIASTLTVLAVAFALSASTTAPLGVVAVLAITPTLMWVALWATTRRREDTVTASR